MSPVLMNTEQSNANMRDPTFAEQILNKLITPEIPEDTNLHKTHWALAGKPSAHLQFTQIPDKKTLEAINEYIELLHVICSLEGCGEFQNQMQLKLTDKLMLLKSIGYGPHPTLMDRMVTSIPTLRLSEQEKKPDNTWAGPIWDMFRGR